MEKLSKRFPTGVKYDIFFDPTQFIRQSVDAVIETIGEAIMLVVLVVILFLQTWRAAIIPLVAIPVSLVGTFFFMARVRLHAQQSVVVRPGAGDRHRGRRRHRRGRERRAQHRDRACAARGGEKEHERGRLGADRDRARALRRVRAVGVHHRHIRAILPAVRADHRRRHHHFADRVADAVAGDVRAAAQARTIQRAATAGGRCRSTASSAPSTGASISVGSGVSWLAGRTVRRAAIMFVIYLVVIGFGLNTFRQTPVGFIPQVDGGYLIVVVQLPPGASLAAHRRRAAARARHRAAGAGRRPRRERRRLLRRHLHQRAQFRRDLSDAQAVRGARQGSAPVGERASRPSSTSGCPRFKRAF